MDLKAIHKCLSRHQTATDALCRLENEKDPRKYAADWYVFLIAWKAIYTILEQGSKMSAPSRQWFGDIRKARKNDAMLNYLFHARNDEEHGLDQGVDMQVTVMFDLEGVAAGEEVTASIHNVGGVDQISARTASGRAIPISSATPPYMALNEIKLRDGKVIPVPHMWRGMIATNTAAHIIGKQALETSAELIRWAKLLHKPST